VARWLLLARHGQVESRWRNRYVGRTHAPLDNVGERQAEALGRLLLRTPPACCVSSPQCRAASTARTAAASLSLEVTYDPDLLEIHFGSWEGKTFEEIQQADPDAVDRWAADPSDFTFPEGESVRAFHERVARAVDRLAADPAETVLAVSHGGVIRAALCHLLGLPFENHLAFGIRHACLATVEMFDGAGVLSGLDNTCSLEA